MDLIKRETSWFLSDEGKTAFEKCKNLEDRSIFIYSYLSSFASKALNKNSLLFRIAFLLADEIYTSNLPYASYPALLSPTENPYVAYAKNAKKVYGGIKDYCIFLSILHNICDPFNTNDWIYDQKLFEKNGYYDQLEELDSQFFENGDNVISGEAYNLESALRPVQVEIAWLFYLYKKEGK